MITVTLTETERAALRRLLALKTVASCIDGVEAVALYDAYRKLVDA